jgi:parallel beta-helix repeat protein
MISGVIQFMRREFVLCVFLLATNAAAHATSRDCDAAMRAEVLAPATPQSGSIVLDCSLQLSPTDVVTRQLVFRGAESSGITLDCNGASLTTAPGMEASTRIKVISSPPRDKSEEGGWLPAENILIKRCVIQGAVRVSGMAINGEDKSLSSSSRREGHTERVRANAPRGIIFSGNQFIGNGAIPIYFSPGVHDSMILDSRIGGFSRSVAIYLDAESGDNTIQGNQIETETTQPQTATDKVRNLFYGLFNQVKGASNAPSLTGRELLAVDGSARNRIVGNRFSNLDNGGIFLYRNCGEGGNIRHQTPQGNQILDNVFYYDKFDGRIPAIWLGSRNGNRSYCDTDHGYPLGSSLSDLDFASNNVVSRNRFHKFEPNKIIRDDSGGNRLMENQKLMSVRRCLPTCMRNA